MTITDHTENVTFDTYRYLQDGLDYWPVCKRCGGTGNVGIYWVEGGSCFDCRGRGTTARVPLTETQARTRAQQLNRSRDARVAKRASEQESGLATALALRAAFEAAHPELVGALQSAQGGFLERLREALEQSGTLTANQVKAGLDVMASDAERALLRDERSLLSHALGEPGEKVAVTGTIETLTSIAGSYGSSMLVVLVTDGQVVVKTFTTAAWGWEVSRGERVTLAGTVKKNETYQGVTASVLTRCKKTAASA
jgi:hypothetical protein